jgi:hypothetical protein
MTYLDSNTDLIWQPDTRVSSFPSGLLLVQRTAKCRKTENKRAEIAVGEPLPTTNTPEIDGLYIFPEAQERRDPAFTEYDVSAYGRSTDKFTETYSDVLISAYTQSYTVDGNSVRFQITKLAKTCVFRGVILSSASLPVTPPSAAAEITLTRFRTGYPVVVVKIPTMWQVESSTRTNYGVFDELVMTWKTVDQEE